MAIFREEVVSHGMEHAPGPRSSQPRSQASPFVMPFVPGQLINGKYEIVELIGVGGLGFVVAAIHVELGDKVALKFLRPEALSNAEAVGRFAREGRASAKLRSEHVTRVFDVGTLPDGAPFIVMEYLEGIDLGALLQERGALPVALAIEYVLQTCEALAAAHACGVVHRDIKPENLFLNRRAQGLHVVKVLDFGISKVSLAPSAAGGRHPLVETTMAMGSPIYMSPEQLRAAKDIDPRTDIWSLGCVLYELLTNRLAFDATTITEVTALILERETPSLRSARPEVPAELELVIQRCLAKLPAQRFHDVAELALALAPFAPPRARVAVERCSSILQSANSSSSERGSARASLSELIPLGPMSSPASSTSTVEAPARPAPATSKAWPLAVAALTLVAAAVAGLLVRNRVDSEEPAAPLAVRAAAAPAAAPPVAAPAPPLAAATPAPISAASPSTAGRPRSESEAAGLAGTDPSSRAADSNPPSTQTPVSTPSIDPEGAAVAESGAGSAKPKVGETRPVILRPTETTKPKLAAAPPPAPRRRLNPPTPKPRPAPGPRSVPAPQEEPDIGF
jgi:serine/threonine protein kinase